MVPLPRMVLVVEKENAREALAALAVSAAVVAVLPEAAWRSGPVMLLALPLMERPWLLRVC